MDYQKAYSMLVGVVSEAIEGIEKSKIISQELGGVVEMLKAGLEEVEEMYLVVRE